jgi:hypothetical protein
MSPGATSAALFALSVSSSLCVAVAVACGRGDHADRESKPATAVVTPADTAVTSTSSVPPAVGVAAAVTATDTRAVAEANEYLITPEKWSAFVRANDTLAALRKRDAGVRAFLDLPAAGAGAAGIEAGERRIKENADVNNAIARAGLSARDYLVMSIAVASAARFMNTPAAAPPTPATRQNAEFLRAHSAELEHVRSISEAPAGTAGATGARTDVSDSAARTGARRRP